MPLPQRAWEQRQTSSEVVAVIDRLLDDYRYPEAAAILNGQGLRSGEGLPFTARIVARIQRSYQLTPRDDTMFNFSANHLFLFSRVEYRSCAVLLMLDRDTQRVYRLLDSTKRLRLSPERAYCIAGKVNSTNTLYLVIESVKLDTKHRVSPLPLFVRMAREVTPSRNLSSPKSATAVVHPGVSGARSRRVWHQILRRK